MLFCYYVIVSIQCIVVQVNYFGGIFQCCYFFLFQFVSIDFVWCWMFFDFLIYQWLGCVWFVGFVVVVMVVVYQVDEDIMFKGVMEIECQMGYKGNGFWIICVNVENWCLNYFIDISIVWCRMSIQWIRGGEINLVVDNDMYCIVNFIIMCF